MFIKRYTTIALTVALALAGQPFFGMDHMASSTDPVAKAAAPIKSEARVEEQQFIATCKKGDLEAAQSLIAKKPEININAYAPESGITALMAACRYGHLATVKFLIEHCHAHIHAADSEGCTAEDWASFGRQSARDAIMDYLRAKERELKSAEQTLIQLCKRGKIQEVIDHFNDYPEMNVNARNYSGDAALITPAGNGNKDIVTYLVEQHAADVNIRGHDGETPLLVATIKGHKEIVAYLLDHGADVNARDHGIYIPLIRNHLGTYCSDPSRQQCIANIIRNNLSYSWGVSYSNLRHDSGMTPLMFAAALGDKDIVELLVERGADLYAQDQNSQTALYYAKNLFGQAEISRYLRSAMVKQSIKHSILRALLACEELVKPMGPEEDFPPELIDRVLRPTIIAAFMEQE